MATRGRVSIDELLIGPHKAEPANRRPDPPRELAADEAVKWREIVASMPLGHFAPSHFSMLVELCRFIVAARCTARDIAACRKKRKPNKHELRLLLSMQLKQAGMILKYQRAMRLTQFAVIDRGSSKKLRPVQNGTGTGSAWHGS